VKLQNKVAIVTGSSRGIGRAIALAFAKEGADVVINYLQSVAKAKDVVRQILDMKRKAIAVKADVSKKTEVEEMVSQTLITFGRIDILVNNSAILLPFDFKEPNYENWQRMVDVNIKGILLCSSAVADQMLKQKRGKIINIVIKEFAGSLDYIMTKAADDVLNRGLAKELAPYVLVNAIAPGCIDTGWISELPQKEQEALVKKIPLGRWGQPEDIAKVAVFLASDDFNWMTGATIHVDGGEFLSADAA